MCHGRVHFSYRWGKTFFLSEQKVTLNRRRPIDFHTTKWPSDHHSRVGFGTLAIPASSAQRVLVERERDLVTSVSPTSTSTTIQ